MGAWLAIKSLDSAEERTVQGAVHERHVSAQTLDDRLSGKEYEWPKESIYHEALPPPDIGELMSICLN